MKKLLMIAAVALLPLALAAQTKHVKLTNDGAFASISTSDSLSNFQLQVSRGASGASTTTNLLFVSSSFSSDLTTATVIEIVGPIPNSSFSGDNTKTLVLDLDPSTLDPTVTTIESCTLDFTQVDPTFVCGPLPAGTIHLSFQKNDIQENRLVQTQTTTLGPVTIISHQRSEAGSATVQGTVFGTSISSSNGNSGVNHLSSIEFTRK
jgi:hypothetical protein